MSENLQQNTKRLIRSLEDQRYDAVIKGDFDQFSKLTHPELAYIHSSGVVDTLESYVTKCREGYYVYQRIDHPVDEIRVYGECVLVLGKMNADLTVNGEQRSLRNKSMSLWTKLESHWKLTVFQATPIQ